MAKRLFFFFFIVINFTSCSIMGWIPHYYTLPDGGIRPKKSNFSFAKHPYHLADTNLIDTNAVYFNLNTDVYYGSHFVDSSYVIYRFFNNGKLLISYAYEHKPTNKECNSNSDTYAFIGYYKIKGTKITIEIYTTDDYGGYNFYYGEISDGLIVFTHWKPRTFNSFKQRIYPYKVLTKYKVKLR
ncbi:MAG: hypothetical protein ABI199_05715 [Bacteroidia bacterium]